MSDGDIEKVTLSSPDRQPLSEIPTAETPNLLSSLSNVNELERTEAVMDDEPEDGAVERKAETVVDVEIVDGDREKITLTSPNRQSLCEISTTETPTRLSSLSDVNDFESVVIQQTSLIPKGHNESQHESSMNYNVRAKCTQSADTSPDAPQKTILNNERPKTIIDIEPRAKAISEDHGKDIEQTLVTYNIDGAMHSTDIQ
jgi:hypothetical protein